MRRKLFKLNILLLLVLPMVPSAFAEETLQVATRHVPPFAIRGDDGYWSGVSIDLWRAVAERLEVETRFTEMDLKGLLDAVAENHADAVVAALTITSERERRMDFTHAFLSTGLGIAVQLNGGGAWVQVVQRLMSGAFLKVVGALLALLLVVGLLVWLLERRRNQQFGGRAVDGIGSGLWWSAVTMTTVGYGDKAPQTLGGRAIAIVWMFASVIVISSFTAAIATALTVGELGGKVQGEDDLGRVKVATVAESTSTAYLDKRRLSYRAVDDVDRALELLASSEVDAVVYDAPILRYRVRRQFADRVVVLPGSFERQDYGFALPSGSPWREQINRVLLEHLRQEAWKDTLFNYLGNQ